MLGGGGPDGVAGPSETGAGGVEAAPDVVGDAGQGQELGPFPLPELVAGPADQEQGPDRRAAGRRPGRRGRSGRRPRPVTRRPPRPGRPGSCRPAGCRRRRGPRSPSMTRHPVGLEGGAGVGGEGRSGGRRRRRPRRRAPRRSGRRGGDRGSGLTTVTCSTRHPSTSSTSRTRSGRSSASERTTPNSSMATPSLRSRTSMPTMSPRTAPMREATAPRAPGRSGSQTRRRTQAALGEVSAALIEPMVRPQRSECVTGL